ncbi:hypothetical protein N0B44_02200 [Roseibacterium beibuensis]|uniref:Uncharacterized protein n=1 Tax=[Roseibacterium] beibuensis TaxID=1193142 RepID=A0ABP9L280_9RHOB|nr:hypothetical protein [Roseibacterium beibuensis]MCS6621714.1 hypothetical protein [Roseibacterium beibuensis]
MSDKDDAAPKETPEQEEKAHTEVRPQGSGEGGTKKGPRPRSKVQPTDPDDDDDLFNDMPV